MNWKIASILAICAAVITASISGVIVYIQRADAARAAASKAESEEEAKRQLARKAEAERAAEEAKSRAEQAKVESEKIAQEKAETERENKRQEAANIAAKRKIAEAERDKADAEARSAADLKSAKELERKIAKEKADEARAKEATSANELAQAEATKAIREAETLKLRVSISELAAEKLRYEELNSELLEYQRELDERERALRPEKTIADLSWIPDEDTEVDENGRVRPKKKKPYLAEDDLSLPKETRQLAKANRIRGSADNIILETSCSNVISRLEPLYVLARKEGRVIDAEHYRLAIKTMYPDWEYKAPESKEEAKEEVKK